MKKKIILFITISIISITLASCGFENNVAKQDDNNTSETSTEEVLPNENTNNEKLPIDSDIILENLKNITKSPRGSGTEGEKYALNYIDSKMSEYGYNTKIEEFPVYERKIYNPNEQHHLNLNYYIIQII